MELFDIVGVADDANQVGECPVTRGDNEVRKSQAQYAINAPAKTFSYPTYCIEKKGTRLDSVSKRVELSKESNAGMCGSRDSVAAPERVDIIIIPSWPKKNRKG